MTELFIGRLTATAVAEHPTNPTASLQGPGSLAARVPALLANLADHRLAEALAGTDLPGGEWCLRRVDLRLALDPDRPGPALETQWAAAVLQELQQLIRSGSAEVLHFPRISDAVNDMAAALATGRTANAWAWRQLGLLTDQDPEPAGAPAQALLSLLRRWPELALSAVVSVVAAHGAAGPARVLGRRGWTELATIVATAAGVPAAMTAALLSVSVRQPDHTAMENESPASAAAPPAAQAQGPASRAEIVESLTGGVAGRSVLARAFLRSGFRADPPTAAAWALLAAAEFDAGLLHRADAPAMLLSLSTRFLTPAAAGAGLRDSARDTAGTNAAPAHPGPGLEVPVAPGSSANEDAPDWKNGSRATGGPPQSGRRGTAAGETGPADATATGREALPEQFRDEAASTAGDAVLPDTFGSAGDGDPGGLAPEPAKPTLWAGLPFLLATADDAGIPDLLLADPALAGQPLHWILHRLGQLLVPAAPDDPAVMAFAGLPPGAEPPARLGAPDNPAHGGDPEDGAAAAAGAGERAALAGHATRWATATAARLRRAHLEPFGVVAELAARRGTVLAQNGWIEVHLGLADVDVDVRRAGLDIDPGWIPWLGTVVRYVYT